MSSLRNDSAKEPGPSNSIYEIVMVAIAAAILLMCAFIFIVLVVKRQWFLGGIYNANYTEEGAVSSISVNWNSANSISTANFRGPVYISYINEKSTAPSEIPIAKVKLSRDALLYISLITCVNLPDDIESEESL